MILRPERKKKERKIKKISENLLPYLLKMSIMIICITVEGRETVTVTKGGREGGREGGRKRGNDDGGGLRRNARRKGMGVSAVSGG